jgi:hypothetical protein
MEGAPRRNPGTPLDTVVSLEIVERAIPDCYGRGAPSIRAAK